MRPLRRSISALLVTAATFAACREFPRESAAPIASTSAAIEAPRASANAIPSDANDDAFDASDDALDAASDALDATDGAPDASAPSTGCPPEMARAGRFCIDRWEAHLLTPGPSGELIAWPFSQVPEPSNRYEARSEAGVFPQGYISRNIATLACKNAGKRLCSMEEWRRGCQGKRRAIYPYGGRYRSNACNSGKVHLLTQMFGSNAGAWKYDEAFNSPRLLQEPDFLTKTGERSECVSPDGVFDMVGNLHEWVSDVVTEDLVDRVYDEKVERRKQPWREGNGIFMGGFFSTTSELGPGCSNITVAHEPSYHDYSIGFRCCRAAETSDEPKHR